MRAAFGNTEKQQNPLLSQQVRYFLQNPNAALRKEEHVKFRSLQVFRSCWRLKAGLSPPKLSVFGQEMTKTFLLHWKFCLGVSTFSEFLKL